MIYQVFFENTIGRSVKTNQFSQGLASFTALSDRLTKHQLFCIFIIFIWTILNIYF